MEKTEPSLVPEWLKASGTSSPHRHQQDEVGQPHRQRPVEQGYSSYVPPRRLNNNNNNNNFERFPYERELYSGGNRVYPSFGRGAPPPPPYRSNSEFFDREKEIHHHHHHRDWDSPELNGRWSRSDHELPVRRPLSLGNSPSSSTTISSSFRENGNKVLSSESTGYGGGPVQKATFDRNFPSLGAQEKPSIGVYSSLANVAVLSPRHHLWSQTPSRDGASGFENRGVDSNGAPAPPKMAEALVQNPPRVKTPPQLSAEAQRLEELQLKQSRQLVPVMPKTTTLMNSRDKSKAKVVMTPGSKLSQTSPRPASGVRPETPKGLQSKLQVLKPGVVPESPGRNPGATPSPGSNAPPRKQKQLLDRRQVPIPPLTSPSSGNSEVNRPRSKENGEDKRVHSQAQNRIDFFNAIRKKAANAGGTTTSSKPGGDEQVKVEVSGTIAGAGFEEKQPGIDGAGGVENPGVENGFCSGAPGVSDNDEKHEEQLKGNGVNGVIPEDPIRGLVGGSEEEENRFLRSLGWVEDAGGEGELTEEEINAFYQEVQEHMRSKTRSPLSSVRRLQNAVMSFRCTGMNSFNSGINSSDSESDCEARAAASRS